MKDPSAILNTDGPQVDETLYQHWLAQATMTISSNDQSETITMNRQYWDARRSVRLGKTLKGMY